jgi:hypothetical protein
MEEWNVGILGYWDIGILGIKAEIKHFNCKKLLQTIIPLLHYSTIPIGAQPLSSYALRIMR